MIGTHLKPLCKTQNPGQKQQRLFFLPLVVFFVSAVSSTHTSPGKIRMEGSLSPPQLSTTPSCQSLPFIHPPPAYAPSPLGTHTPHTIPTSPPQTFLSGYPTGRVSLEGEMGPRCLPLCLRKLLGRDGVLEGLKVGRRRSGKDEGGGHRSLCANVNSSTPPKEGAETPVKSVRWRMQ